MIEWDGVELCRLCEQKGRGNPTVYIQTMSWRQNHANFHRMEAEKAWSRLYGLSNPDNKFIGDVLISYEANLVACILALHSMADILDQIVNITILEPPLPEGNIRDRNITPRLEKCLNIKQISDSRKKLRGNKVFDYINAFCNTIKHRRLMNIKATGTLNISFQTTSENCDATPKNTLIQQMKPVVDPFNYNGKKYPKTLGSEILENYTIQMFELTYNVGININEYLRNI